VHIENKHPCHACPAPAATRRDARVARTQAALFPTRLALARWTRGGDIPHVFATASQPLRAAWYGQAQRGFQHWLEAGGFHAAVATQAATAEGDKDALLDKAVRLLEDAGLACPLPPLAAK